MHKLTVLIINFNGAHFLNDCLDSVISQRKFFSDFNILVIENASSDDSLSVLNQYENQIELIVNDQNVGFPPAVNQALPHINSDYIWLLNNDTQFDQTIDLFHPIINYMDVNKNVAGVSPKLLNTDLTIQIQGSSFGSWRFRSKNIRQVPFLAGAALFVRTNFFKQIGGFDANFFFYNDDIDFAKQVKRHKKKLIYYPDVSVIHHGGLSTKSNSIDTMIGGYFGSVCLCKKFYSSPIFIVYYWLMRCLIRCRKIYYSIFSVKDATEWVEKLHQLEQRLINEI